MQKYFIIGRGNNYFISSNESDKISIYEMKKTGQFIEEYKFWFLAKPKAKYDFSTEHFILREKDHSQSDGKYKELYTLIEKFSKSDYVCLRNAFSIQSIPLFVHYHIAKFKDMDGKIGKLLT